MSKAPQRRPRCVLHRRRRRRHRLVGGGGGQDRPGRSRTGRRPASARAARPASVASPEVVPPTRRSLMPVRSVIHSSLVSMVAARSSLVTILSGRAVPQPVIATRGVLGYAGTSGRPQPGDGLATGRPARRRRRAAHELARERASAPRRSPTWPSTCAGGDRRRRRRGRRPGANTPAAGLTTSRSVAKRCSPSRHRQRRRAGVGQRARGAGRGRPGWRPRACGHRGTVRLAMPVSTPPGPSSTKVRDPFACQREQRLAPPDRAGELGRQQAGPLVALVVGEGVDVRHDGHLGVAGVGLGDGLAEPVAGRAP